MNPDDPPIRVCLVVAYFYPHQSGAERQALEQGAELARRGHEVHVVTQWVEGLARDEDVRGLHVHRWFAGSKAGPLFGPTFVAGVVRALQRLRPRIDLVHTHQALWEAIATGVARPWLRRIPTLVQPASSGYFGEAEELRRTRGAPLLRRLILRNTAFAAISADIERQWLALGVPPGRLARTRSGVDADHYRPAPSDVESSLPPRPRVVFTGRLHPQKNLDLLLDAWPEVARRTAASLVLVGDGPERARLAAKAEAPGLAGRVHFAGAVPDAAEHLRAADVFALPSVAEGMSNSLLEAMATGLPCVASAIGGNDDLLGDGRAGVLVPVGEVSAWVEALVSLLGNTERARSMGRAARNLVESTYAIPVVVDDYLRLYRRLLAGESANPAATPRA
jgi:glycosyltransferase involved in cell wall biosynthesis